MTDWGWLDDDLDDVDPPAGTCDRPMVWCGCGDACCSTTGRCATCRMTDEDAAVSTIERLRAVIAPANGGEPPRRCPALLDRTHGAAPVECLNEAGHTGSHGGPVMSWVEWT